jgi:hypothetical protein
MSFLTDDKHLENPARRRIEVSSTTHITGVGTVGIGQGVSMRIRRSCVWAMWRRPMFTLRDPDGNSLIVVEGA